jgi:hypothetical protein
LWSAADEIDGQEGKYVKIMLLTGKRKTALAQIRLPVVAIILEQPAPGSCRSFTEMVVAIQHT